MAKGKKGIEYRQRLKELKNKLKPYRNKQTVNLLRVITGSSGVQLDNYWESLESVLTGQYSSRVVQERIQSVVNMITENQEKNTKAASHSNSIGHKTLMNEFEHFNFESKANESDNVTHVDIDSKANVLGDVRYVSVDSKASVLGNMTHGNINSNSNVWQDTIDSKANVLGNMTHGNINPNSNVWQGTVDTKANMINRLQHLHIGSGCSSDCYRRF
ncbi:unnamed protein product [Macrosiphum euphorbiae]|uniref:Uncharacterized protein n=1 Tax=Macrosiphum euphorbiae TaxID=13131 RepID=A0AAV0W5Y0_9HEMI|nr:unnamed protein product [Macrosiphum euphorbiae]